MYPVRYTCTMLASMRATASSPTQDRHKVDVRDRREIEKFYYLVTVGDINCKLLVFCTLVQLYRTLAIMTGFMYIGTFLPYIS
jgi:hypothetical protein